MDSITQVVLGASVGEAVLGKKAGKKAPIWGAICGTIPDLDIVANFFMDELSATVVHRGFTHSILFSFIAAPVIGYLIHKIHKEEWGTSKEWTKLAFWSLLTHPLLDCFTTWGTQLFYPISSYRVAFNNIFVVDPLYTLPFLIFLILAITRSRESKWRKIWNWTGLIISSFYLVLTITNKLVVDAVFTNSLHAQGKSTVRLSTYPSPLNNILWYCLAEDPYGFNVGYYSLLGDRNNISYLYIPKNEQLIQGHEDDRAIEKLEWMSKGFYTIEEKDGVFLFHDLRFGLLNGFDQTTTNPQFPFSYELIEEDSVFTGVHQIRPDNQSLDKEYFGKFWDKIMGR